MKIKKTNLFRFISVVWILIAIPSIGSVIYAENLPLEGNWNTTRSISNDIPFADVSNNHLTVKNTDMPLDMFITLIKDKNSVFELKIPASETSVIIIPVDNLKSGTYTLEIRNLLGGYLAGNFVKE